MIFFPTNVSHWILRQKFHHLHLQNNVLSHASYRGFLRLVAQILHKQSTAFRSLPVGGGSLRRPVRLWVSVAKFSAGDLGKSSGATWGARLGWGSQRWFHGFVFFWDGFWWLLHHVLRRSKHVFTWCLWCLCLVFLRVLKQTDVVGFLLMFPGSFILIAWFYNIIRLKKFQILYNICRIETW